MVRRNTSNKEFEKSVFEPLTDRERDAAWHVATFLLRVTARRRRLNIHLNKNVLLDQVHEAASIAAHVSESSKHLEVKMWIEAADTRHRYGSRLVPYYKEWLASGTNGGFFRWLDEGGGKHIDLEACPRAKLERSNVEYLDNTQREHYEVEFRTKNGAILLFWKLDGGDHKADELVTTPVTQFATCCCSCAMKMGGSLSKYIYVVDLNHKFYIRRKRKGKFHHSSFICGRPARAAGSIVVKDGQLVLVNSNSGHYKPTSKMIEDVFGHRGHFANDCNLDPNSFSRVHPRNRKLFPCCPGKYNIASSFPC